MAKWIKLELCEMVALKDDLMASYYVLIATFYSFRQVYNMVVEVSDGRYSAQTNVYIELIDMNDNIPQFTQSVYSVSDVYEEDNSISSTNRLPIVRVCISS